jgi:hypothetical protein
MTVNRIVCACLTLLHPLDDDVNQRLAGDGSFFKAGDLAGNTLTLMGASMGAYGLGRAFGDSRIAHVGVDLVRAQIVTEGIVQSLKYTVQRPRPNGSSGYSFPSGHAAVTLATATVLDRHRTVTRHGASNFALVPEPMRGGVAVMFVRIPKTSSQIADRSN